MGTAILHLHAMRLRRVTLTQVAFRQAVVREEQLVERLAQPRLGGFDQGIDVSRVVIERLQDVILQTRGETLEFFLHLDDDGLVRGHRVVRVLGHHEQVVDASGEDLLDGFGARGRAVAHAHDHRQARGLLELGAKLVGRNHQGRTLRGPDAGVGGGAFLWAGAEDDTFQQQPAQRGRIIDDAVIVQEFTQVVTHVGHGSALRRTKIQQQDTFTGHRGKRGGTADDVKRQRQPRRRRRPGRSQSGPAA